MTTAIPTTAAELEEMLGDSTKMQDMMGNPLEFKEFITNYAHASLESNGAIGTQIKAEIQRGMAEFLKKNKAELDNRLDLNPLDHVRMAQKKNAVYNGRAAGTALDNEFTDTADFFQAIWHKSDSLRNSADLTKKREKAKAIMNSFGSNVPDAGGFLVPEVLRSQLLSVALETSIVRSRATVIPMDSLRVPIPTVDDTSHVSSVFGGLTFYWNEEGASLVESQASFGRLVLEAKKLTGYAEIPNELMADAPAFNGFFSQKFPEGLSYFEDMAFMTGTGVGEPEGFLNAPSAISVPKQSGQATGTIVWENIVAMYSRMLPTSLANAVWIASIDTFPELATMALSVGTGGSAVWLNNGAVGAPVSILGRPVIFTEKVPSLTNLGDINFVDLSYYLIGDRQVMSAESSPHYRFQQDKTAFRVIERVDGRTWLRSAITPHNGGATLSPIVQLQAR
jgi:HK97 family phage major capsid protein